jgi:hypothetical protein
MKKIFKALSSLAAAVILVTACNVEHPMPTYSPQNDQEVSFVQSVIVNQEVAADATTFDITLARNTSAEAATIAVATTLPSGVTVPSSVTFNAGESTATLTLDVAAMEVGKTYKGTISLSDTTTFNKNVSVKSTTVTLQKVYTWVSQGKGQYMDFFFMGEPIDVEILKAEGFNRYRVMNPYPKDVISAGVPAGWYAGGQISYFDFNINEDGTIKWDGQPKSGAVNASVGDNAYIWGYYPLDYHSSQTKQAALCKTLEGGQIIQLYIAWIIENSESWYGYNAAYINMPNSTIDFEAWLAE